MTSFRAIDFKKKFFLDSCNHLLKKAARSEDLISYCRNIAMPLVLDYNPYDVDSIDTSTQHYLTRMGIESKQDYVYLARYALMKLSKWAALDETQLHEDWGKIDKLFRCDDSLVTSFRRFIGLPAKLRISFGESWTV